jgi:hypothetical protein
LRQLPQKVHSPRAKLMVGKPPSPLTMICSGQAAQAVIAARATVGEFGFGKRPGRANFSLGARSTAKESAAAGIDHALLAQFHLVDAAAQHLVDFRTRLNLRQQGFPVSDALLVVASFHGCCTGQEQGVRVLGVELEGAFDQLDRLPFKPLPLAMATVSA